MGRHFHTRGQFTTAEDFHEIVLARQTVGDQVGWGDSLQTGLLNQGLQCVNIDALVFDAVGVLETELRNATLQRHLSTFKSNLGLVA